MSRGYTLIEILIVLVIATILFFGGFGAYREFTRRQILNGVYNELGVNLSFARELAWAGEKPTGCTGVLAGYVVAFLAESYTISATCPNSIIVRTITLPSGVTIASTNFMYKVLGQGTTLPASVVATVAYPAVGRTISAIITKEGILQK
ncbi:MAG: prepilin-type N-terminal cleavage/methylation domain-containing protein [Patescibacteria group bacterium]